MAQGKPSTTARRREVRRKTPPPERSIRLALRRREVTWACVYGLGLTLCAAAIAISANAHPHYQEGQVLDKPVVTRVAFQTIDEDRTRINRQKAYEKEPPTYRANDDYREALRQRFDGLGSMASNARLDNIAKPYRDQIGLTQGGLDQLKTFFQGERSAAKWDQLRDQFIHSLFGLPILGVKAYDKAMHGDYGRLYIVRPEPAAGEETSQVRQDYAWISIANTQRIRGKVRQFTTHFPHELQPTIEKMVMADLKPTYRFAPDLTRRRREAAREAQPVVERTYEADHVLLPADTRLSSDQIDLLRQERVAYRATLSRSDLLMGYLGTGGTILFIVAGLWGYVFAYNRRVVQNPMRGLAAASLMLLCQGMAAMGMQIWPQSMYAVTLGPVLLAAMVLAIVYDQRLALAFGAILTLLVTVTLRLPVTLVVILLTGVCVAVAQLREVRTRSKLVWVGLWTGLAAGGATLATALASRSLQMQDAYRTIGWDALGAAAVALGCGLLVQGILPAIEKLFKITTAMTLKELNDASHPLLQRLAQEAPGTYQHSLRIADMAEAAAEAIRCDGLLCRVAAMYHDIGKINKPMYFIENQGGGPNRHTKISPAMSLLIIVGHVKDGIEMAREYALPPVLRHFIESHHGTTLVEYFYHAAKKQKEAEERPAPSQFEFRYPGPKPRTREAAIMLLCDGIEAVARTMDEPTPVRLEQVVHTMANKRLMDGQFDECNLTLADLSRIEQAITKTLCAVYHSRIKYPAGGKDHKGDHGEKGDKKTASDPSKAPGKPTPSPLPAAAAG